MSANARRAEIIRILRNKKQTTAAYLADALYVSTRTIERDIQALIVDEGYRIDTIRCTSLYIMACAVRKR